MSAVLCRSCADWAFTRWRGWCSLGTLGWEEKPDLPAVPVLVDGRCPRCGGHHGLAIEEVVYQNYHSEYSTGLPDYYVLAVDSDPASFHTRWGRPYRDSWITGRVPMEQLTADHR